MEIKEELKKPENYVAAALGLALLVMPFCRDRAGAPVATVSGESAPDFEKERRKIFRRLGNVVEEVKPEEDEEPSVGFNPGESTGQFYVEEKLADCIQAADNTCYLRADFSSMTGASLNCFSDAWEENSKPVVIRFNRRPYVGTTVSVVTPFGEAMEYEKAPHPSIDPDTANDFYTDICRDVAQQLTAEPQVDEAGDFYHDPDFDTELSNTFADGFDLLTENGFKVSDEGFNVLKIAFEEDGTLLWRPFYPKQAYCLDASTEIPCWKYEPLLSFNGPLTIDGLLEYSLETQEAMDVGDEE